MFKINCLKTCILRPQDCITFIIVSNFCFVPLWKVLYRLSLPSLVSCAIWLIQIQISDIFEKDQSVISRHIKNILKDNEVDEKSNMQKMHIANSDKPVSFYSLDIILAVGYRTNSSKAVQEVIICG